MDPMPKNTNTIGTDRTPPLEWIASTLGAMFAVSMIGYLVWDTVSAGHPPDITVEAGLVHQANGGFTLSIKAINHGGATAAEVEVEGTVTGPDGASETSTVTFDFVPGESEREGALVFSRRPTSDNVNLRMIGFRDP
jgi:uncharacterized protein (TIGR02588 family)